MLCHCACFSYRSIFPVPANNEGRVRVWRPMVALRAAGANLALLSWYDLPRNGAPSVEDMSRLAQVFQGTHLSPIRRSLGEIAARAARSWRWPSHAAARWVTVDKVSALRWATDFAPNVILLDGLYGSPLAMWLSRSLGIPVVYRSHNIEHLYMSRQLRSSTRTAERLALRANLVGLRRLEESTVAKVDSVFDISTEDAAFWRSKGARTVRWLPTPMAFDVAHRKSDTATTAPAPCDVLYFGNLNTPNNVAGVRWLVTQVLPLLGSLMVRIVGSRPNREIQNLVASDSRIEMFADPLDMLPFLRSARVLVNPVQSGSGVDVKSIEMLFSDAGLVSTSIGVRGLPDDVKRSFAIADDAAGFAKAISHALDTDRDAGDDRAQAREHFMAHRIGLELLEALRAACH